MDRSVRSFAKIFHWNWSIHMKLCGAIAWNFKNLFVGFFPYFSQNSFELSSKYDAFCHLSPFYYETFTRKFLLGFAWTSTYHNSGISALAAGAPSTIYFNYFHIAHTHTHTWLCTHHEKKLQENPTPQASICLAKTHTRTHTTSSGSTMNYAKPWRGEKRAQIVIVVTNE